MQHITCYENSANLLSRLRTVVEYEMPIQDTYHETFQ